MEVKPIGNTAQAIQPLTDAGAPKELAIQNSVAAPAQLRAAVQQPDPAASAEQVTQALKSINEAMQSLANGLEFSVDAESKRTVVKVVDQQTGDVIRQMPTKEALEIARALDKMQGLLVRQKA